MSDKERKEIIDRLLEQLKGLSVYDAVKVLYETERQLKQKTII
jgi:hypothetical protein